MKHIILLALLVLSGCMVVSVDDGQYHAGYLIFNYNIDRTRLLVDRRATTQRTFINNDGVQVDDATVKAIADAVAPAIIDRLIKGGMVIP